MNIPVRYVIDAKRIMPKLPIVSTAVLWLLIDRYHIRGAWFGVIAVLWALWWFSCVSAWIIAKPFDPWAGQKP